MRHGTCRTTLWMLGRSIWPKGSLKTQFSLIMMKSVTRMLLFLTQCRAIWRSSKTCKNWMSPKMFLLLFMITKAFSLLLELHGLWDFLELLMSGFWMVDWRNGLLKKNQHLKDLKRSITPQKVLKKTEISHLLLKTHLFVSWISKKCMLLPNYFTTEIKVSFKLLMREALQDS